MFESSRIVNGRGAITPEMARRLSRAFNTSPELWLIMQVPYDLRRTSNSSADWRNVEVIGAEGGMQGGRLQEKRWAFLILDRLVGPA